MKVQMMYGTAWKKDSTAALVETAVRQGFVAIDTANQAKHYQEALVGEALLTLKREGFGRENLFLQTKFTPIDGQDHRLPYDPEASLKTQVRQSFESSLEHLGTDYLDSYLLHGPYNHPVLADEDWEVWSAMEELHRSGGVKQIGISNVNAFQIEELAKKSTIKPTMVQNRCFANRGWDEAARKVCREHGITYQGFSLLTANPYVLEDERVLEIAARNQLLPPQIIFRFAIQAGMIALTGTTNPVHMAEDLKSLELELLPEEMSYLAAIGLR